MKLLNELIYGSDINVILSMLSLIFLFCQYTFRNECIDTFETISIIFYGLYLADLGTGCIHVYFDTYSGNEKTLTHIASGFQIHHHQRDILNWSLFETLKPTSIVPLPIICIVYNFTSITSKSQILFQIISLYSMFTTHITHRYAHLTNYLTERDKQKPEYKLMMFLQDNHLILHPKEHNIHHTSPKYDINFCMINGWANPLLNSIVHIPFIHSRLFPDDM